MANILKELHSKNLVKVPPFVLDPQYLTIMGSEAYGCSSGDSDKDIYGFCMPPMGMIFPHKDGFIQGYDRNIPNFEQWQQHHILDKSADSGKGIEYDFSLFGILRYFELLRDGNPNMTDSIFTPQRCVLVATQVGQHVRDNRKLFLHKGCFIKYKSFAFAQLHKMQFKGREPLRKFQTKHGIPETQTPDEFKAAQPDYVQQTRDFKTVLKNYRKYWAKARALPENPKRAAAVQAHGYDTKFAQNIVRLALSAEQILMEGDLDLERHREQLKSVRRGEWTEERIVDYFNTKERELESLYVSSKIPHGPDEAAIKKVLLQCLEQYYGSLDACITQPDHAMVALQDIQAILTRTLK